jgi:hypothetical protein
MTSVLECVEILRACGTFVARSLGTCTEVRFHSVPSS